MSLERQPGDPRAMITEIEDFFALGCGRCDRFATPDCSTKLWTEGLATVRRLCLDAGLSEHVKWGHPCYMHAGRNIALFGAFRDDFRLTLMNAALMTDPERVLEKQGPNTRHPDAIRFRRNDAPAAMAATVTAYLREAMGYAEQGLRPSEEPREVVLPDELVDALDADPELADAFGALTPGRQRSYAIALASARASATRVARIERLRPKIFAGKGAQEY